MLDSAFELISQAASNPHMVFCFCNLIIVMILVGGSSKPTASDLIGRPEVGPGGDEIQNRNSKETVSLGENVDVGAVGGGGEESSAGVTMVMVGNEGMGSHEEADVVEDDGELERRVEEFIEKINRSWRAEKLRSHLSGANE